MLILYALGAGISIFLGNPLQPAAYISGSSIALCFLFSARFLHAYFQSFNLPFHQVNTLQPSRGALLIISLTFLTIGAVFTVILFTRGVMNPTAFVFIGTGFVLSLAYALPPLQIASRGYGEIALSILLANIIPGLALSLQYGDYHRLLPLLTFPFTLLSLAAQIAFQFPDYPAEKAGLLLRLGWQRAMTLHNLLILLAYILLVAGGFTGLPWSLTWPGLLGLPFALFQIWQMVTTARGAKPRWQLLVLSAASTLLLTAWFLTLALWTR